MTKKEIRLKIAREYLCHTFENNSNKIYTDDLGKGIQTLSNGKVKYVNETKKANVAYDKIMKQKVLKIKTDK